MRIEIAGALSCGKSTLAGELELLGHRIIREDILETLSECRNSAFGHR